MTGADTGALQRDGTALLERIGPGALRRFAMALMHGSARDTLLAAITLSDAIPPARGLVELAAHDGADRRTVALYLLGLADGAAHARERAHPLELVWGGPGTGDGTALTTGVVLAELIAGARQELLLTTYSAAPHPPLVAALIAAAGRGVHISIIVETHAGARGALSGREPAAAFLAVPGAELWHWPAEARSALNARQHAKLAVADRSVLLLGSANLTGSGIDDNLEAGVLVKSGPLPARAADHLSRLQRDGTLVRLTYD